MRIGRIQFIVMAVLVALSLGQLCHAQNSSDATLEIIVRDPSGALVSKAQIQLLLNSKPQSSVQTNQKGEGRFNRLTPGQYQLRIQAAGFSSQEVLIVLKPGPNRVEVSLEIDVIKADVRVAEEA